MKRNCPLKRYTQLRAKSLRMKVRRSTSPGKYKKRLWSMVSEYIRRKYADHTGNVTCVTCGTTDHWKRLQAGHYIAKNMGTSIYFEEKNIHPQCVRCNMWLRGNLAQYALFLIKTYGPTILDELDTLRKQERHIKEAEYIDLIAEYREKLSKLEKLPEAA